MKSVHPSSTGSPLKLAGVMFNMAGKFLITLKGISRVLLSVVLIPPVAFAEFSEDVFISEFSKKFEADWSQPVATCIARGLYAVLSDEEKSLIQVGLDILVSDPEQGDDVAGEIMRNLYDNDEKITQRIQGKWDLEWPKLEESCG